jgi:tetratricopeptide (TPR) repeat protein
MGDRLRALWDFDDLVASEERFRSALENESSPAGRAEVLTQLARVAGLRREFADADRLVDDAESDATTPIARARVDLERGRIRRSSGDKAAALPLFESAFATALEAGAEFVAVDAAHMAALAAPDDDGMIAWTERGIVFAERSTEPEVTYWLGPLLNNLGWHHYGNGEYAAALDAFERALAARERDPGRPAEREIARYAVGKALRALDRPAEAVAALEQAVAWTQTAGNPDGWFHEELAEDYAAAGSPEQAAVHARLALPLLLAQDPSFADDNVRRERLRALAEALSRAPES